MLLKYYSLNSPRELKGFLNVYIPLVVHLASKFSVDLTDSQFQGDHLGVQALSAQEFDECHNSLLTYSTLIHDTLIHKRRNRVYQFNQSFNVAGILVPRIEIFEPKPEADLRKLKPGVEHIAFKTTNYDKLLTLFMKKKLPVDKSEKFDNGSMFFKTSFVNLVEIEFRNDSLGVSK